VLKYYIIALNCHRSLPWQGQIEQIFVISLYLVCSPPPVVPPDAVTQPEITPSSVFMIGDVITYSCTNPAFDIANNIAVCQDDGTWIPDSFVCNQIGKCPGLQCYLTFSVF